MGLYLAGGNRYLAENAIVVEARAGISRGSLHRLVLSGRIVEQLAVEPHDATAAMAAGGTLHRWDGSSLREGVYLARSVGEGFVETETYFEIIEGEVRRDFGGDHSAAERELRRRSKRSPGG